MEKKLDALTDFANALSEKAPSTVKDLGKVLLEMTTKFLDALSDIKTHVEKVNPLNNAIKAELASLRASVNFTSESFDELKTEIKSLRKDLNDAKNRNLEFQKENAQIKKELCDTRKQLIDLQQYSRRNNIELKGIPFAENEDLEKVVEKIADCLRVELTSQDLDVVHRVPTKTNNVPNIVVKFVSRSKRDKVLKSARKNRLNTAMLGFKTNVPVFVNEHLCLENKVLLSKTIQRKKDKNWRFVWVSEGKVLARKSENSKVIHISCEDDLAKLV